ncbi:MAG: adenylyl-sulfate kinase [Planctomycetes bacterium]|nr:adenylyl-sulfate kinase [Planctomycetota bacterium]
MAETAFTIWITGLSSSGKTTVAQAVTEALRARGKQVECLDSGAIRRTINRSLGFSRDEIETNLKRLAYDASMLNRNGVIAVVSAVSPYRRVRDSIREASPGFVEVYCRCPMEVLVSRDPSGLFDRAQRGKVQHVAGINAPYEEPLTPEVLLNTDGESPDECAAKVIATLELLGRIEQRESSCYTAAEEELIKQRLQDLGYL